MPAISRTSDESATNITSGALHFSFRFGQQNMILKLRKVKTITKDKGSGIPSRREVVLVRIFKGELEPSTSGDVEETESLQEHEESVFMRAAVNGITQALGLEPLQEVNPLKSKRSVVGMTLDAFQKKALTSGGDVNLLVVNLLAGIAERKNERNRMEQITLSDFKTEIFEYLDLDASGEVSREEVHEFVQELDASQLEESGNQGGEKGNNASLAKQDSRSVFVQLESLFEKYMRLVVFTLPGLGGLSSSSNLGGCS